LIVARDAPSAARNATGRAAPERAGRILAIAASVDMDGMISERRDNRQCAAASGHGFDRGTALAGDGFDGGAVVNYPEQAGTGAASRPRHEQVRIAHDRS